HGVRTAATSVFSSCSRRTGGHSDLGQINVNWFEELTREAIRLQPRLHEDEEKRGGWQDTSLFKTPQHKRSLCSQLESTPSIFREQSLCSPLFLSPTKDHEKSHVSAELFFRNVLATELSPDTSAIPPNETFGTSSRYLADSPVVMKQLFKAPFGDGKYLHTTPRQDRKFDMSDSLLCTPQLIRDHSSRCISESLGVQADPEMSWSSSLATPPSPTVIIAQAKEEVCKLRKYDREDVLIVHSLFSKKNNVAEAVSSAAPDTKTDRDSTEFANTMTNENMEKSSDYLKAQQKKTVLNAVGDGEACQVVENAIEGMEDVLSIFFTNEKPPELRKIKVDRRIKRKIKLFSSVTGKNDSLIENTEEQTTTFTSENLKIHSKLLEQKACLREVSLSYEWTPLNLPDTTQEDNLAVEIDASSNTMENSTCNDSQLHRDEHTSKASNETNKYGQDGLLNSSQYMEHKEKSEERLPDEAAGDSEPLVSGDLSSFATEGDFPWKSSSIAEQKPKLILSTLKKQNRFLYSLKMDYQQSETTEKIDTTLHGEPSKGLETPDAQSKRSLDLKNAASPHSLPEIKQVEKDDDFKDNRMGFQEILEEEAFLNIMQTDPTATSGVKSAAGNCTELQVAKSESISQIEYEASQHSEGMVAHSNTKARVLDSVTRDHSVHEDPYTSRKDCDSICSTPHPGKAESKSANRSCDLPAEIKMLSFVGFKTASNKKIHISEDNLRKAELLLKEDEALPISIPAKVVTGDKNSLNLMDRTDDTMTHMEFHRASPKEMVTESRTAKVNVLLQEICQNPSKRCKTNNTHDQTTTDIKLEHDEMTGSVEPNASRNLPEVSHEEIKEENKTEVAANTRKQPSLDSKSIGDIGFKENSMQVLNLQGIESHLYDVFTESQKAEINELSSILENAGSQFDFTQVKKLNLLGLDHENMQNPKKSISESQKLNTSDVWEDVDFNDSFATGEGNLESNVLCVVSEPENKSDIKTNACNITDNNVGFKRGDGTVSGFTSGKSVNITDEDLVKAIEMFGDLEEKAEEKMTKTVQDLNCSPRPQTVSGLHLTANDRTATQSVSNVSDTIQATTSPKLVQSKEKYFSDIEFYSNQEDGCKSKENHATKLQPRRERPSSERSLSLLVEGVQNCDIASSSYENSASASDLSTMPVGFATGKGKAININKAALDKARTMFIDILDMSDPGEDHCRTPPVHGPSGLLTNAPQANNTFAEKETHGPKSYHGPEVSNKESKVPKVILDGPPQEENQKLHVLRKESNSPRQDNLISNRSLFSTASGKSLQLSEEGLKRAHKVFSDVDGVHVGDQQTGIVSREPTVNSGSLLDSKNMSALVKETTFNFPQPGFSTANGKLIGVSQKCLQKARELFSDIGEPNDLDVGQRNPSSQSIAQVRRNKPLVNQVTADLCSEILADLPPLDNLPNKEMSTKTSSGEHEIPEMRVMSLSTAGGKSILLSEDSLRKAQGMFSNIDDNLPLDEGKRGSSVNQIERKNPKSTFPPLGFSTASGRAVAVSLSSLQKARQMFAATDDTVSDTGLTYQSTKSLTRKEDTLEPNQCLPISNASSSLKPALNQCTTNPKGEDTSMCFPQQETPNRKMAFFSTASGSHVHLSSKALQKAREMFADLDDGQVDQPLQENVKEKAEMMDFSSKNPDNTMQVNAQGVASLSVGFNTASGKTVTVSHDSLQKAKLLFADADNKLDPANSSPDNTTKNRNQREETGGFSAVSMCQTSKTRSSVSNFSSSSKGNESGNNTREPVVEDGCVPKTPCFSTAGGKTVTVSKESLKRVREIFSEVDNHCSSQHDATVDMQPNPISTSAAKVSLRGNNKEPEPSEIQHSSNVPTKNSFGFSTASGKQVCVSEDALQKVKSFFEEFDTNENLEGNLNENQDSARIHTLNPLLNKQPLKLSVTKLDHRQKNTVEGKKTTSTKSSCSSSVPPPGLVKHSTPLYGAGSTHLYFTSSHTPENEIEIEAAESAKAFMDDEDLTDAELKADGLFLCPDKLPNIRNGKRFRSDDGMGRGEPPIKRQLLPEFDRSLENESKPALKPLTSSPHERLKDRRKFLYKTSLQPLSSGPASFSKGKEATLETMHAPPSYPHSKLIGSRSSLPGSSAHISADCKNDRDNVSKTVTTSFVTPFKKDPHVSSGNEMVNSPRQDQDYSKGLLSKSRMEVGASKKDESGPDFSNLVANICCARDMQEMRIRKKQRQKIKPQPGSLYLQKTSSANRIDLVTAVEERQPTVYTQTELYRCGVIKNHIGINSETARTFAFHCLDYFTRERFLSEGGVQIADGGWLVPTDKLSAGREEFYRALCDTPGVDPKLITPEWVYNHCQWIVWKLAAMEVKFPMTFAGRCLTPDRVLLQLKYRYDVEIDQCRRSAVRKIMERDDTPAKTLVLCISKILTLGNCETSDTKQTSAIIEVTDGWYGIKALLDPALTSLLKKGRMFIGQKIIVHGAELVGSDDACTPLEAPDSLMLKIAGNSTRPARWYTKLGYFHDPRPFCLHLSSLLAEGGIVGCVDVLIQRSYPIQWMEKMGNGTYAFRNERAEEREAEKHSVKQQKNLEVLYVKIQEEYEKEQVSAPKRRPRRQSLSEPQIRMLQDGAELYEALQNEPDPSYLESSLSSDQLRALNHHRQVLNDKRHAQIQADFRKAIESSEQEPGGSARRDVTPVWKIRIVDYKDHDCTSAYMLNIWRPLPDVVSLLKEGGRFKIYQLAASQSKGKSDTAAVQLTATKKTQFQQLQPLQQVLDQIYTDRQVTPISHFLEPHFTAAYGEVDVVGLVISTQQKPGAAPLVYMSDETCNVVALKFYTDLGQLALEELTRPHTFISAANLRWRSEYVSGVPTVFAGDLSFVAANPKEHHLQKAIQKLRQSIESVAEFCKEMENKLMNVLQAQNPQDRASLACCSVDPRSHLVAGSRCSTPGPKINNLQMKPVSTPAGSNTVLNTSTELDPKTCKKMKGLDYLSRIPSPAPLTPVGTLLSPSIQRAFRPPRSLHKEDRTRAKTTPNPDSCTPSKLEGGFVADEELAMINTQALVRDIQKKITPNVNCPESGKAQMTEEESREPYQRRLCRKRKQKP
ncbi:breast cancer type 2 susceptibility protein, partial [Bufo bufo]|uniref:breast cancer type 2 susceptibility protein n=1 Tax=Bufo bufo TaxID=8384 RepID=UPI001ABE3D4E